VSTELGMVRAFVSETATRKIEFYTGMDACWQFRCSCGHDSEVRPRISQICVALANHICYNSDNGSHSAPMEGKQ
jgi:hypothetical protein